MSEETHDNIKNDYDKLKDTVLNDYQYYDRRFDTVSMIFSGFGLYSCFEMLKWYLTVEYLNGFWLFIPILIWLLILFIGLYNIGREKKIRGYYIQQLLRISKPKEEEQVLIRDENIKLEDNLTYSRKWVFGLSIFCVVMMLVSLGFFLIEKTFVLL